MLFYNGWIYQLEQWISNAQSEYFIPGFPCDVMALYSTFTLPYCLFNYILKICYKLPSWDILKRQHRSGWVST